MAIINEAEDGFPFDKVKAAIEYLTAVKPVWTRFANNMKVIPSNTIPFPGEPFSAIVSTDPDGYIYIDNSFARYSSVEVIAGAIEFEYHIHARRFWNRFPDISDEDWRKYAAIAISLEINSAVDREEREVDARTRALLHTSSREMIHGLTPKAFFRDYEIERAPTTVPLDSFRPEELGLEVGLSAERYLEILKEADEAEEEESDENSDTSEDEDTTPNEFDDKDKGDGIAPNGDAESSDSVGSESDDGEKREGEDSEQGGSNQDELGSEDSGGESDEQSTSESYEGSQENDTEESGSDSDGNEEGDDPEGSPGDSSTDSSPGSDSSSVSSGDKNSEDADASSIFSELASGGGENSSQEGSQEGLGESGDTDGTSGANADKNAEEGEYKPEALGGDGSSSNGGYSGDDEVESVTGDTDSGLDRSSDESGSTSLSFEEARAIRKKLEEKLESDNAMAWKSSLFRPTDTTTENPMIPEVMEFQKEEIGDQARLAKALSDFAEDYVTVHKDPGLISGDTNDPLVSEIAGYRRSKKVDFASRQRRVMTSAVQSAKTSGATDMSLSVRNPNQPMIGAVLPGTFDYTPRIYFIQDVSGSMRGPYTRTAGEVFSEVCTDVAAQFSAKVLWIAVDFVIRDVTETSRWTDEDIWKSRWYGGGNTDISEIAVAVSNGKFEYKGIKYPEPDVLAIMTDGQFTWPEERPKMKTKWVVTTMSKDLIHLPKWLKPDEIVVID